MTVPNKISFCSIAELKGSRRATKWAEFLEREAAFLERGGKFIFPLPQLEIV